MLVNSFELMHVVLLYLYSLQTSSSRLMAASRLETLVWLLVTLMASPPPGTPFWVSGPFTTDRAYPQFLYPPSLTSPHPQFPTCRLSLTKPKGENRKCWNTFVHQSRASGLLCTFIPCTYPNYRVLPPLASIDSWH